MEHPLERLEPLSTAYRLLIQSLSAGQSRLQKRSPVVRADLYRTQVLQVHFLALHQQAQFFRWLARLDTHEERTCNYREPLRLFVPQFVDNFFYFPSHDQFLQEGGGSENTHP